MTIQDKILKTMFELDILDDENTTIIGIAKQSVDKGYTSLTEKQKKILNKIFSIKCNGYEDPGGHFNECNFVLEGDSLYEALVQYRSYDSLLCEDCRSNLDYFEHHKGVFFQD